MKNITILGGGVLGTQIALQSAFMGKKVTIWLRSEDSIKRTKPKLEMVKKSYIDAINKMASKEGNELSNWSFGISDVNHFNKKELLKRTEDAFESIIIELDIKKALKDCDLVIESMSEDFKAKKDLLMKIAPILNSKTIVATNSSTLLPSKLAKYSKREDKFLALHFANSIWKNNIVEVMKHEKTNDKVFKNVINFAKSINMIPMPLYKEKSGYLLNSMLIPFLFSALDLLAMGISDVESIDETWKKGTGAVKGPFEIIDTIGLKTAHDIVLMYVKIPAIIAPYHFKEIEKLLKKYIDEGKLGKNSKRGFYKYE